ncbi:uncharacterized protein TRIVIDRAFT_221509 [Trichoderma virens Gv29-8]|uniref:Uncharacterized protein n=1 Tax=Hypocrea virens (strain Gv29-8 / FGSC 10586) TaxID=413071 RepID=G9MSR3_HYPVG|nr:uncharacterized protein TRIVIDRAFT_221509 [Trichoderma virens Gv29-8]EHK22224.1 hypothetical protein TRIVIDRAFT_221509 [Trichoderma virens Gv29-8]
MAVDYYHRQAVLMTPEEQAIYLRMIDKSDFLTSPSNQNTPSNNKLWKYLVTQRNPYCRAHFVMLASIYGTNRLIRLRSIVEGAGDEFEPAREKTDYITEGTELNCKKAGRSNNYILPSAEHPPRSKYDGPQCCGHHEGACPVPAGQAGGVSTFRAGGRLVAIETFQRVIAIEYLQDVSWHKITQVVALYIEARATYSAPQVGYLIPLKLWVNGDGTLSTLFKDGNYTLDQIRQWSVDTLKALWRGSHIHPIIKYAPLSDDQFEFARQHLDEIEYPYNYAKLKRRNQT